MVNLDNKYTKAFTLLDFYFSCITFNIITVILSISYLLQVITYKPQSLSYAFQS